jgi:tRNA/rRNA methyltransferase
MIDIKFILVETSHAGNIGASARAIKVMGFNNLCLVNPKCDYKSEQAIAMSSNALDLLDNIEVFNDNNHKNALDDAIADAHINIALTSRKREYTPPIINSKQICDLLIDKQTQNGNIKCNIIFGNEQFGLSNEDVLKCSHILHINANPEYSSLNLSQAVQIIAYELSTISLNQSNKLDKLDKNSIVMNQIDCATAQQITGMHNHLLQALVHINFYDESEPKRLAQRLQTLWAKSELTTEEVNILRGIAKHILKKV